MRLHPPGDYVSDLIRAGIVHEWAVISEVERRLRELEPGVLVDVGAMIGTWSMALAERVPHTVVHAFEPSPENLPLLEANVAGYRTVTVHPLALSAREELLRLVLDHTNRGHSHVGMPEPEDDWVHVPAIALDQLRLEEVRLVKVDVEGHELQVLSGARRTIERWHPLLVLESWSGPPAVPFTGYRLAAEWEQAHQTYLYAWAGLG